jgi:hypothetical protein
MKYFLDTEFYEDGTRIHPISLGMVADDGRELYFEMRHGHVVVSKWVKDHVVPHLTTPISERLLPGEATDQILEFIGTDTKPEFWAYFADYDWIFMCQLFGTMMDLPQHFPKVCMDIQQFWIMVGKPHVSTGVRPKKPENQHHALADARWNREFYNSLMHYYVDRLGEAVEDGALPRDLIKF